MPSLVPLDNFLGAAFIGIMLATTMFGITCLQVYLYYTHYSSCDGRFLKLFVALLTTLNAFHIALLAVFFYHYAVTNFGDYEALTSATWSLLVQVIIGDVIGVFIRSYFAYRIYRLNERRLLVPVISWMLNIAAFCLGTAYVVESFIKTFSFVKVGLVRPYTTAALTLDTVCDMFIAASLVYSLKRKTTTFVHVNKAVGTIISYALHTCVLTNICTLACLITWVLFTDTLIYAPFFFIYIQLYSCSFMSTLNSREAIRENFGEKSLDQESVMFTSLNGLAGIRSMVDGDRLGRRTPPSHL